MFTGIVRERARVVSYENGRLVVQSGLSPKVGDSVAVDGTCLTVVDASDGRMSFDVMAETASRSKPFGDEVNLEPALAVGDPLGGHFVQGHVDGLGRVRSFEDGRLVVEARDEILRYCVDKGSITVDGVALTITRIEADSFEVALIPHTLEATTIGTLEAGDEVNLEADVLAKYVERLMRPDTI